MSGRPAVLLFLALLLAAGGLTPGCRSSQTASSEPQIVRPGKSWRTPSRRLTAQDERTIEAHARFSAGIIAELENDIEGALAHYRAAIQNDPENEELTLDIARKFIEMRRLEDARQLLESSARRRDASGLVWGLLGSVYTLQGNPDAAIRANQQAIRRMPAEISAYQNLAQIYVEAGQATNALAVLEQAAAQPDADSAFLILLANTLGVLQQLDDPAVGNLRPRILELLDRAAALEPEDPVEILRLADLYQLLDQTEKSLPLYQHLIETDPDLPGLRERLTDVYLRLDDREKAVEQLRILANSQPANPLPHFYLGMLALDARRFDEAIAAFSRVLVLRPDNPAIYYELAIAHLSHDQPEQALDILARARARFRPSFQLEYLSALANLELQRYSEAIRNFTAAEVIGGATAPERLTALFYFQSGVAYERANDYDDAAVQFQRAIELQPDFAEALNYLGYMWAEQGMNLDHAHDLIRRAVEIEPDNDAFLDSLAWVLHQMGRSDEALPHQLRAIELSEEPDPTLYEHLGDIYLRLGRPHEAREAWLKAQSVEPKPELERKLRELDATLPADPGGTRETEAPAAPEGAESARPAVAPEP